MGLFGDVASPLVQDNGSPASADSDTTAAADQAASAATRLQQRHRQYLTYHAAFNHGTKALDQAIKAGLLLDAEKPPDLFVQLAHGQIPRGPTGSAALRRRYLRLFCLTSRSRSTSGGP